MSRNPIVSTWLWDVPTSNPGTEEETEQAREWLLGNVGDDRIAWLADRLGSASAVLKAVRAAETRNGGGGGPGGIGEAAYEYGLNQDGIVAWFGDEPERWRAIGNAHNFGMGLLYLLEDVPPEKIRHVRLKLADVVRAAVERSAQPSLLESA